MEQKQKKSSAILLWTASVMIVCLILSLPVFDTALQYSLRECIGDGTYQRIAAMMITLSFLAEYLFLRAKKWTALKWIPVVFPVICLVPGELFWLFGGWDRIAGLILWWFGFPMLVGASLAVFLRHMPSDPKIRTWIVAAAAAMVVLSVIFWPRPLADRIDLEIGTEMLFVESDGTEKWLNVKNTNAIRQMIQHSELVYAPIGPDWDSQRVILLRLSPEFIVAARYGQAPYVYAYSGELEDFDGSGVRWRFYYFPALYTELFAEGESVTEETIP